MTATSPRFYVYVLALPNGNPFYVGKGQDTRVYEHELEARRNCQCHKCRVIRKVWKQGGQIQRYILLTTADEQEAMAYEIETIALYGRKNLTNKTDGGNGTSGRVASLATRAKMSAAIKAAFADPNVRAKLSASNTAAWTNAEVRARMTAAMNSPETRAKVSAALNTPEARAQNSAKLKAYFTDPEARARVRSQSHAYWSDPEARAKQSAWQKARLADPEARRRMQAAVSTPEARAKLSASLKAAWVKRKAAKKAREEG